MHLVPAAIRDQQGRLRPHRSPFDVLVSLPTGERSGMEIINAAVQAMNATAGVRVIRGTHPFQLLTDLRVKVDAEGLTVRDLLTRVLQSSTRPITWRMFYAPGRQTYVLNLPLIQ